MPDEGGLLMELTWEQNMRRREVEALEKIAKNTEDIQNRLYEIYNEIGCIGG